MFKFKFNEVDYTVLSKLISSKINEKYELLINDKKSEVTVLFKDENKIIFSLDNETKTAYFAKDKDYFYVWIEGRNYTFNESKSDWKFEELADITGVSSKILAPMPGIIIKVCVSEDQSVESNTPLIIMESMKMENTINSPGKGKVKKIHVTPKQSVELNSPLIELSID